MRVDFGQLLPKIYTSITGVGMSFDVAETHGDGSLVGVSNTAARLPQVAQTVEDVMVPYMSWLCSKTKIGATIFGQSFWEQYVGDIGEVPALPATMAQVLTAPCPFWPSHRVYETHLLTLIPARVNGEPLTLNLLRDLIQSSTNGENATRYRYYSSRVQRQFGDTPPDGAYCALVTRDVLPGSCYKDYAFQKALVANYEQYTLPSTLAVVTSILCYHARSGERLLSDTPMTYTRCKDVVTHEGADYPVVIGGFDPSGLYIFDSLYDNGIGVVSSRKF